MTANVLTGLTWGFAAFAFCVAIFNLWLYWLRPRDPAHLWLGVMSLGVVWLSAGWARGYQATTVDAAQAWLLDALIGAIPFAVGVVRFSETYAGIRSWALRAALPYAAIGIAILLCYPDAHFTGEAITLRAPGGEAYLIAQLTPAALAFLAPLVAAIGFLAYSHLRAARALEGGALISRSLAVFGLCLINDMSVLAGTHWTPFLSPLGFALFAGAFGLLLLRRLVRSQRHLERSASELYALVGARTAELRRKDIELAHGARLATLGALAGGIAHEVERPLDEVAAHVKQLRSAWREGKQPEAVREPLAHAQRGIERIRVVVAELLQLARREEGARGRHELAAIVASVLPVASYELRRRALLRTHLASAPPVHGDAAMLAQIALNLIVGAIQSAPEDGAASGFVISLETGDRNGRAFVAVTDTAAPLASRATADLFDLDARDDADDARRVSYAVTKQLVERHGGALTVDSSDAGNRVVAEFPAAPAQAAG